VLWKKKKPKNKVKPKVAPKSPMSVVSTPEHPKRESLKPKTERKKPEHIKEKIDSKKEFLKVFERLTYRHNNWDVWRDFILMFACALSNPVDKKHYDQRESLYLQTIKRYNKQEQPLFSELAAYVVMALEENPEQDFLGSIFMELNLGNEHKGQFFTPYHVCELMAEISMDDVVQKVKEDGYITVCDPCCGSGANLIAAIHTTKRKLEKVGWNYQNHILLSGQDIDMTVGLMCYIQLSLLGVAAYIKIGNTLTEPMSKLDSMENFWFTPIYFSDVWTMRRLFRRL